VEGNTGLAAETACREHRTSNGATFRARSSANPCNLMRARPALARATRSSPGHPTPRGGNAYSSVGRDSEAPALTGEVHGRRARVTEPTTEVERTLKGRTPGGHRPHTGFRPAEERTFRGDQSSVAARICLGLATPTTVANGRRAPALKWVRPPGRSKALKVKPQERYRDETSPERCGGV
jgi:hypothetical protein